MDPSAYIPAEETEAVAECESDPDEVKHSLVMRRRETSDDEEREKEFERRMNRRIHMLKSQRMACKFQKTRLVGRFC